MESLKGKKRNIKKADLRPIFGSLKLKMTGQQFKDLVKKGWD